MANSLLLLYALLLLILMCDDVEAGCYTSYSYYYNSYRLYCNYYSTYSRYYSSSFSLLGAVIGSVVGFITLIGIIVFFCCIRRRRQATTGRVIHNAGNMTVVSTNTVAGGYTSEYPQVVQSPYPQYSYPAPPTAPTSEYLPPPTLPQQTAPPSEYQPPPYYEEYQPQAYPGDNTSEKARIP